MDSQRPWLGVAVGDGTGCVSACENSRATRLSGVKDCERMSRMSCAALKEYAPAPFGTMSVQVWQLVPALAADRKTDSEVRSINWRVISMSLRGLSYATASGRCVFSSFSSFVANLDLVVAKDRHVQRSAKPGKIEARQEH